MKNILAIFLAMFLVTAQAQSDRSIKLIVPFPPGGSTDAVARVISAPLAEQLNTSIIVDNRAGAGGAIATKEVANSAADGSVLLMSTVSTFGSNHAFMKDPGFDPIKDFEPIITVASTPKVIAVRSDFPANTVEQLIKLLQQNTNKYIFGTSGRSADELYVRLFKTSTNTSPIFVPYKGGAPALIDLLGGHTHILIDNLPLVIQHVREGKLKLLAISWPQRLPEFSSVPTWGEIGYPDMNISSWQGIVAPRGLSKDQVTRINGAIRKVLSDKNVQDRLSLMGFYVVGDTPLQSARLVKETHNKMTDIGQRNNIIKN